MRLLKNDEVLENIQVNIIVAENFNQETNTLNKIFNTVEEKETISFSLYLSIRIKNQSLSEGMFDIYFDVMMQRDEEEDSIYGFNFSSYRAKFESSNNQNKFTNKKSEDEDIIVEGSTNGILDKLITIKRFEEIPLNGKGTYNIVAFLVEEEGKEEELPQPELILDSFQFRVE